MPLIELLVPEPDVPALVLLVPAVLPVALVPLLLVPLVEAEPILALVNTQALLELELGAPAAVAPLVPTAPPI